MTVFAQAPGWLWAKSGVGNYDDRGHSVCIDAYGNAIVTGMFYGPTVIFGSDTLINASPTGVADVFIVRYDPSGNVLWTKRVGGNLNEESFSVCTDYNGNIYVGGAFLSDSIVLGNTTLHHGGVGADIFIVKYDTVGNLIWAIKPIGADYESSPHVTCDANGDLLICGSYLSPTLTLDTIVLTNTNQQSDCFIAKFNSSGNVLWAISGSGTGGESCDYIATDINGNVIIGGTYFSPVFDFGGITLTNMDAPNLYVFVMKFDNNGNGLWGRKGSENDVIGPLVLTYGVATDTSGNVYITGNFGSSTLTFDSVTIVNSWNGSDIFIVKYNASGSVVWAKSPGEDGLVDIGSALVTDPSGNLYLTGSFDGDSIIFDGIALMNTAGGNFDFFLVKYDPAGNVVWTEKIGGIDDELANGIAMDENGSLFVTGNFSSANLAFGSNILQMGAGFVAKTGIATGIVKENSPLDEIRIFPNPSNGKFRISNCKGMDEILISDILGQTVFKDKIRQASNSFDLNVPGIYFVTVTSEKQTVTKKIIIQD